MLRNHFEPMTDNNANIYARPKVDTQHLAKEGWQVTIGDLHANTMKLIYMLCRHGVMQDLSVENHRTLLRIYNKQASEITTQDLELFTKRLKETSFNQASLVRLLGSEMANKGNNDFFTLTILKKLHDQGIKVEILFSNYSFELIKGYENYKKTKEVNSFDSTELSYDNAKSLHNFSRLIKNKKVTPEDAIDLIETGYLPSLKLLSYGLSSDKTNITLYSHAPIDINIIQSLSKKLEQPYNDRTPLELAQTIDAINQAFQTHVQNCTLTNILDLNLIDKASLKNASVIPDKHPIEFIMLNNTTYKLNRIENYNGFKVNFVHGRIDPRSTQNHMPNVTNLYTSLGKGYISKGEYSALYTQEHQTNPKEEAERKAIAENERIAKEEAVNKKAREEADRKATVVAQQKAQEESDHKPTPDNKSEKELADEATDAFRNTLNNHERTSPLYKAGLNLLKTVNNCKNLDDAYRRRLMVAAKNLNEKPESVEFQNNYANILKDNTDGKRSISGMLFGAAIAFLGAAIIGASIALGITVIGMPLASGVILIGSYVMTVGLALLINNRQKGTQQALIDYQHTLFKSASLPLPQSQTQHPTLTK